LAGNKKTCPFCRGQGYNNGSETKWTYDGRYKIQSIVIEHHNQIYYSLGLAGKFKENHVFLTEKEAIEMKNKENKKG